MMPAQVENGHGVTPNMINLIGSSLGQMTESDNNSPDKTVSKGDAETARLFGKRIADITRAFQI